MNIETEIKESIRVARDSAIEVQRWREAERTWAEAADDLEAEVLLAVVAEKGADGKAAYTNEAARQARIRILLRNDARSQEIADKADTARKMRVKEQAQQESAERQFRVFLIDYELDRLGRRMEFRNETKAV